MRARALVLAAFVAACAPTLGRPFLEERAAAERAYSAGRYDEAAEHWLAAEKQAKRRRDQTEARYRAAASLRRAGRLKEAEQLLDALRRERPKSARAARAAFDAAEIEIEHGDAARGRRELEDVLRRYPGSGVAPAALAELVRAEEDRGGPSAALAWLERMARELGSGEMGEHIGYARAEELDKAGRVDEALATYLAVADQHPYPYGALWDDALWKASQIEERRGRPEAAIAHLERMLKEKEPSSLQGSYERPRFAPARYHIAELYRDRLRDPVRARREFRRVWDEHPTSPLKDDALWNEARLEHDAGELDRACSTLERLAKGVPDSRYAPCVQALCPGLAPAKGECHAYVLRQLERAPAEAGAENESD